MGTSRFGFVPTAMKKSSQVSTARPPTVSTRSPACMPAASAGESVDDRADHRRLLLVGRDLGALVEHDGQQNHGQAEVHRRPHDQDLEALPLALGQELVRLPGASVVGVLAGHLHVAAERQRTDAVLGVSASEADDGRVEAELEFQDLDPDALGCEEVPELVHEDKHAEHEREGKECLTVRTSDLQFYPAGHRFGTLSRRAINCAHLRNRGYLSRPCPSMVRL